MESETLAECPQCLCDGALSARRSSLSRQRIGLSRAGGPPSGESPGREVAERAALGKD